MNKISQLILISASAFLSSCVNEVKEQKQESETITNVKNHLPSDQTDLTNQAVNTFEKKFGTHKGKRRNHIDGFCFSGYLTIKDDNIKKYTKSKIFDSQGLKVIGRFSHKGGVKKDESSPGEYGMAFEVQLENEGVHKFSMNTLDFFPVSTPEGFVQLMNAKISGEDEDFNKLKEDHPEFINFKSHYKSKPVVLKSYANQQFNSVNTFIFENEDHQETPVRWSFMPKNEFVELDSSEPVDFFKETQKLLDKGSPLVWEMIVTISNKNDAINDASIIWEGKHKQITAATLTIEKIFLSGDCDDMIFDPLTLTDGVKPSDDPILKFRSPAYIESFMRRTKEKNIQQGE